MSWLFVYVTVQRFIYCNTQIIRLLATLKTVTLVGNFQLVSVQIRNIFGTVSAKRNFKPLVGFFHLQSHR